MQEIAPGLWHWTGRHERTHSRVSSYYLGDEGVAIDAIIPREGLDWFEEHGAPAHVLLTNRHHDRHAWKLRDAFGCTVHCISNGVYEIEGRGAVQSFEFGDELPGGVVVHEVDAICPDETALYIPGHRALACADGVVRASGDGPLTYVPDWLMDDPEKTKRGLRDAYRRLLELTSTCSCSRMAIRSSATPSSSSASLSSTCQKPDIRSIQRRRGTDD